MPTLATNKKAHFEYNFLEKYEAGIMLVGSEVKAIRMGNVSLKSAYVVMKHSENGGELFLVNCHIGPYPMSGKTQHEPERSRKLLLKRREISSLSGKIQQKGLTLVVISLYTKRRKIKLEFALAKGKKQYEKREIIKKRETDRELRTRLREG